MLNHQRTCDIEKTSLTQGLNGVEMELLIWTGAILSILGLVGLFWCIKTVLKAKKSAISDEELRSSLQKVVPLNMASLFLSAIGLMLVVLGIML